MDSVPGNDRQSTPKKSTENTGGSEEANIYYTIIIPTFLFLMLKLFFLTLEKL